MKAINCGKTLPFQIETVSLRTVSCQDWVWLILLTDNGEVDNEIPEMLMISASDKGQYKRRSSWSRDTQ